MKIKHLLLGIAIVSLMAACGSKSNTEVAEETPVETTVEEMAETAETIVEEVAEVAQTAQNNASTPAPAKKQTSTNQQTTAKQETKAAVDPCEAKVKAFEKWVDAITAAKKAKGNGANELKAWVDLRKQAVSMENSIKDCTSNAEYKTRLTNAILAGKKAQAAN
ncbi:MAG: hypothetical protein J6M30_08095 [Bacteroidales bacterium]|nr:hypothetical protein [Bacteroidales bacterium]